ncbi:SLATT domain-containing protein [Candidatus Nanohaloarchaea archaeon]|nr:SLATT domain-containing protein [Candidatus Nanohaloarchaea archaeon]
MQLEVFLVSEDDFDYEAHERLRERVANKADSALWAYKSHYEAADWYSSFSKKISWITTATAGILTVSLIWRVLPDYALVLLAIATAALSGYKTAAKPEKKSYEHYNAGDAYHRLFIDFNDFTKLQLADESYGLENMKERFWELSDRHQNLNEEMPNIASKWYERLHEEEIRSQTQTTEETKKALTGCARLKNTEDQK